MLKAGKPIIVIYTMINGRKNYVAGVATNHGLFPDKHSVHFTTDLMLSAKEFPTVEVAEEFKDKIHNPHNRKFFVDKETIQFTTRKELNAYNRII